MMRAPSLGRGVVFSRTRHRADPLVRQLEEAKIAAVATHGDKTQGQRERGQGRPERQPRPYDRPPGHAAQARSDRTGGSARPTRRAASL